MKRTVNELMGEESRTLLELRSQKKHITQGINKQIRASELRLRKLYVEEGSQLVEGDLFDAQQPKDEDGE